MRCRSLGGALAELFPNVPSRARPIRLQIPAKPGEPIGLRDPMTRPGYPAPLGARPLRKSRFRTWQVQAVGLLSTTILELSAAPTRTRVIPARLRKRVMPVLRSDPLHNVCRRPVRSQFCRHKAHIGIYMPEEHLVACTQVVEARFTVRSLDEPVLWTLAVACEPDVAIATVSRQRRFLCFAKATLLIRLDQCLQR